jgi:hypothetical protein
MNVIMNPKYGDVVAQYFKRDVEAWVRPSQSLHHSSAMTDLAKRSWFHRMWTVQEAALARQSLIVCGQQSLLWETFCRSIRHIYRLYEGLGDSGVGLSRVLQLLIQADFKKTDFAKKYRLSSVLSMTRNRLYINLKDYIFALYSILEALDIPMATPDYSKSVRQIYAEATRAAIVGDNSL